MPQRFLRPGIRNSSLWNSVSFEAQSLYIRIITLVDDYGRYDGRTSVLWGECFAVWNEQNPKRAITLKAADDMLAELARELISVYSAEGKRVLQVNQWSERVRDGSKEKWPKNPHPQESAGIRSDLLPPSPPPPPSPTPSPRRPADDTYSPLAIACLYYLNEKTGKSFRQSTSSLAPINGRLKETGVEVEGIKRMIDRQCKLWMGTRMEEYLRPSTLFGPEKFNEYYAAKDMPINNNQPHTNGHSTGYSSVPGLRKNI